eukprot:995359-Rhodomonas_salina.2
MSESRRGVRAREGRESVEGERVDWGEDERVEKGGGRRGWRLTRRGRGAADERDAGEDAVRAPQGDQGQSTLALLTLMMRVSTLHDADARLECRVS